MIFCRVQVIVLFVVQFAKDSQSFEVPSEEEFEVELSPGKYFHTGNHREALDFRKAKLDRRLIYMGKIADPSSTATICFGKATEVVPCDGFKISINIKNNSQSVRYFSKIDGEFIEKPVVKKFAFEPNRVYVFVVTITDKSVVAVVEGQPYFDDPDSNALEVLNIMNVISVQGFENGVFYVDKIAAK
ncbi:unnamed protein product [Soboliphyme baturini]|uniref:DUF5727 domain-containing protein n=1 Tax=Soboliphyme baturini TaxID=241478 RepID=A0A183INB6_9BILA|nr:unnamed protein product [Soboliphyme baturini]